MNLRHLSDDQLHIDTKALVQEERELLNRILFHLLENQRRRLFSTHKMQSLHDYAVSLGYSDAAAGRRITAMYLLKECPAIEDKLATGEISLTHLCIAKTFFTHEKRKGRPLSAQKKEEVLDAMAGHTTRGAAKIAQTFSPEPPTLTTLLKLEMSEEGMRNLREVKNARAHSHPGISDVELFELYLREDLAKRAETPKRPRANSKAEMHREVERRAENKCENCGSTFAKEHDHRVPKAAGGKDRLSNFRLLCRSCNQRAAIEFYGQAKMDPYLNRESAAPLH